MMKNMMATMLVGGVALAVATSAHAATVIHNDGFTTDNELLPSHPNYGTNAASNDANWTVSVGEDGVVGTPDIAVSWVGNGGNNGVGFDTYTNWDGRGNVVQIDGGNGPNIWQFSMVFTPTALTAVKVNAFDVDAWANPGDGDFQVNWTVTGATSGLLDSGVFNKTDAGGRETFSPNVAGALGEVVTLEFDYISGDQAYLAMDNLAFDQLVPEPASLALVGMGGLMLFRRRRH